MKQLLVLSALLATAAQSSAPACGFYSPRVFIITAHYVLHQGERTFALTDHRDVPADGWGMIAPQSYDATQIADAPAVAPMTLTLLGDGAPETVTTTKRVFLKSEFDRHEPMGAVELAPGDSRFAIAVSGKHVDMAFAKPSRAARGPPTTRRGSPTTRSAGAKLMWSTSATSTRSAPTSTTRSRP